MEVNIFREIGLWGIVIVSLPLVLVALFFVALYATYVTIKYEYLGKSQSLPE